jgi:hypothetical protein
MNFHLTQNDLPSNTKTTICSLLNARVADAIDLALMTKTGALEPAWCDIHCGPRDAGPYARGYRWPC